MPPPVAKMYTRVVEFLFSHGSKSRPLAFKAAMADRLSREMIGSTNPDSNEAVIGRGAWFTYVIGALGCQ